MRPCPPLASARATHLHPHPILWRAGTARPTRAARRGWAFPRASPRVGRRVPSPPAMGTRTGARRAGADAAMPPPRIRTRHPPPSTSHPLAGRDCPPYPRGAQGMGFSSCELAGRAARWGWAFPPTSRPRGGRTASCHLSLVTARPQGAPLCVSLSLRLCVTKTPRGEPAASVPDWREGCALFGLNSLKSS